MRGPRLGAAEKHRVSLCRLVHGEETGLYAGSADFSVHDKKSGTVLLFSVVSMGGQWHQLQLYPPATLKQMVDKAGVSASDMKELFKFMASISGGKAAVVCIDASPKDLHAIVDVDEYVERLEKEDRHAITTAINEVFA